jgi:hypothetical protein
MFEITPKTGKSAVTTSDGVGFGKFARWCFEDTEGTRAVIRAVV